MPKYINSQCKTQAKWRLIKVYVFLHKRHITDKVKSNPAKLQARGEICPVKPQLPPSYKRAHTPTAGLSICRTCNKHDTIRTACLVRVYSQRRTQCIYPQKFTSLSLINSISSINLPFSFMIIYRYWLSPLY